MPVRQVDLRIAVPPAPTLAAVVKESLTTEIHLTINGIAAGLRNSGEPAFASCLFPRPGFRCGALLRSRFAPRRVSSGDQYPPSF